MTREFHPGMGQAVAERTILRPGETWGDVANRVADGNCSLVPSGATDLAGFKAHLHNATILMSGRHLQHGDLDQRNRPYEIFTNCSSSAASFILFYLLLNGSGVGRVYDDDMMLTNWDNMPTVRCVLDEGHPDFDFSAHESVRDAKHKYGQGSSVHWFDVPDSREGWAQAIEQMEVMAFQKAFRDDLLVINFTPVRCKGSPIGGMQNRPSSGPVPMMNALHKIATLKGAGLAPWLQALYVDHYLAEPVLVGGARRAARMAMKIWTDKSVLEFIKIKRPLDGEGYPFLWSSNNSVAVDADFWRRVKMTPDHKDYGAAMTRHAREVYKTASECAYYDGTGEPGFVNVDMLVDKKDGLPTVIDGSYVGSPSYQVADDTRIYLAGLQRKALSKKYLMVPNPCGEQPLAIFGAYCVSGSTRILHRNGYDTIDSVIGKSIQVYNGKSWSDVIPFVTGINRILMRVTSSDGSYLDCTPEHRFKIRNCRQGNLYSVKAASELKLGDILPTFQTPEDILGTSLPEAYTYGAFLGDGAICTRSDSATPRYQIPLYPGKHDLPVSGTRGTMQARNGGVRVNVSHLRRSLLGELKENSLPNEMFLLDRPSTIDFIRGWVDTDGYADASGGITLTTICEERARGLQLLLRRAGASFASLRKRHDVGHVTNYGPRQHALWQVYIPAAEAGMFTGHRVKPTGLLDRSKTIRQARVVSVEQLEGQHTTYCFSEPEQGMGVFGNMLTYQCTLADVVPYHADTLEEAEDAYKHAARALLRVNTMPSLYQAEVNRTNRIGIGSTGVHEFAWKFFKVGFRDLINPDFEGYAAADRAWNHDKTHLEIAEFLRGESYPAGIRAAAYWQTFGQFSRSMVRDACHYAVDVLGRNAPHTLPTDKPAGTTSKLFGLSEGKHLPAMAHYLRWVQFRDSDPLVAVYEEQGYPVRRDLKTYEGTAIVGFPTEPIVASLGMGDALVLAGDATPEEQYKWLQLNEFFWLEGGTVAEHLAGKGPRPGEDRYGSQISYTLKYKPSETSFEEFSEMMLEYQPTIRCCSVMPEINADDSVYEYLPEQPMTKAEFEASLSNIRSTLAEDIGREHVGCDNGACPVDFKSTQ